MSKLDDKLKELIGKFADYCYCDEYHIHESDPEDHIEANADPNDGHMDFDEDELQAAIKQAFIDEGWMQVSYHEGRDETYMTGPGATIVQRGRFMTGQEWYDKFIELANSYPPGTALESPRLFAIDLAKKAAGIES